MKRLFEQALGPEWNITSAGGLTGDAYIAEKEDKRLFLKRNSSPFLAVLSAERLVPKLVWTKRMENGDVITAQEWLDGRKLEPEEMQQIGVAELLKKIHESSELLHMLMRLGIQPVPTNDQFDMLCMDVSASAFMQVHEEVKLGLRWLEALLYATENQPQVVCHCDLNHNNLMITEEGTVYLVDWDNATIADPAIDFGTVLMRYIPREDWTRWLAAYGEIKDEQLMKRMYWYLIAETMHYIQWHYDRNETSHVQERLEDLAHLNIEVRKLLQVSEL